MPGPFCICGCQRTVSPGWRCLSVGILSTFSNEAGDDRATAARTSATLILIFGQKLELRTTIEILRPERCCCY